MSSQERTRAEIIVEAEIAAHKLFHGLSLEEVTRVVLMRMRELVEIGDPCEPEESGNQK